MPPKRISGPRLPHRSTNVNGSTHLEDLGQDSDARAAFPKFTNSDLFLDWLEFKVWVNRERSPFHEGVPGLNWWASGHRKVVCEFPLNFGHVTVRLRIEDFGEFSDKSDQLWTFSFNPSRLLHGKSYKEGLNPTLTVDALGWLAELFSRRGWHLPELGRARLQRVDIARDFDLGTIPATPLLQALRQVPRNARTYPDLTGRPGEETLYLAPGLKKRNSNRWMLRIYDRGEKEGPEALRGSLRVELQFRGTSKGAPLTRTGLKRVEDLARWDAAGCFAEHWSKQKLGTPLSGGSSLYAGVRNYVLTHEPDRFQLVGEAVGFAQAIREGDLRRYSPHLRRKLTRLLEEAGCLGIDWTDNVAGHLDLEHGVFVSDANSETLRNRSGHRPRRGRRKVRRLPVDSHPPSSNG